MAQASNVKISRAKSRNLASSIHIKPSHKGLLHKKLGVPEGEKIPAKKLSKALNSSSASTRKQAQFAKNARSFKH